VADCSERGNKPPGSTEGGEFLISAAHSFSLRRLLRGCSCEVTKETETEESFRTGSGGSLPLPAISFRLKIEGRFEVSEETVIT
jgi:hypothetical protein